MDFHHTRGARTTANGKWAAILYIYAKLAAMWCALYSLSLLTWRNVTRARLAATLQDWKWLDFEQFHSVSGMWYLFVSLFNDEGFDGMKVSVRVNFCVTFHAYYDWKFFFFVLWRVAILQVHQTKRNKFLMKDCIIEKKKRLPVSRTNWEQKIKLVRIMARNINKNQVKGC